uniref:Uncharacterized protein n=1 Tax=viral metagenome TaxID=1070528 RepID=A0A6M3LUI7_9ZZZZ
MKFEELTELADRVAKKTGKATYVGVSYWRFIRSKHKELKYSFYSEDAKGTIYFNSAQELKAHMEKILNPVEDEGIDLNDLAEDGILRGAE